MSERRDCDLSRGDVQCPSEWRRFPGSDSSLSCRFVIGHPGKHKACYDTGPEWEEPAAPAAPEQPCPHCRDTERWGPAHLSPQLGWVHSSTDPTEYGWAPCQATEPAPPAPAVPFDNYLTALRASYATNPTIVAIAREVTELRRAELARAETELAKLREAAKDAEIFLSKTHLLDDDGYIISKLRAALEEKGDES